MVSVEASLVLWVGHGMRTTVMYAKRTILLGLYIFCSEDSLFCFTVVQILEKGTKSMCNHGQLGERERER